MTCMKRNGWPRQLSTTTGRSHVSSTTAVRGGVQCGHAQARQHMDHNARASHAPCTRDAQDWPAWVCEQDLR
eukprot:72750-Chlamydomonas_euryale.AAC.7